jgi:hypothetical protein
VYYDLLPTHTCWEYAPRMPWFRIVFFIALAAIVSATAVGIGDGPEWLRNSLIGVHVTMMVTFVIGRQHARRKKSDSPNP